MSAAISASAAWTYVHNLMYCSLKSEYFALERAEDANAGARYKAFNKSISEILDNVFVPARFQEGIKCPHPNYFIEIVQGNFYCAITNVTSNCLLLGF